jgi:outer membrane protein
MTDLLLGLALVLNPAPDAVVAPTPAAVSAVVAPTKLTLAEALKVGQERAFGIAIANSIRERTAAQIAQARGGLLPRLTANGSTTRFDPAQPGFNGSSGIQTSSQYGLGLTWAFDISGANSNGIRAAYFALQAADFNKSNAGVDTRHAIRTAYYGAVQAHWNVLASEKAVKNSEERLRIARQRVEVGSSPKFDVVRLEAELANVQLGLISAKNGLTLGLQALNNAMAVPIETEYELDLSIAEVSDPPAAPAAVDLALKSRPDVLAVERTRQSLVEVRRAESKGLAPSLSLSSQFAHAVNPGPFSRKDQTTTTLALSWPIFDGGITKARVKTATENLRQSEIQLDQLKLAASLQVRSALVRFETARQQVTTATAQVTSAEEALRIANLLFENGRGILLDVTTGEEGFLRAQVNLNNARYQLLIAYADLQRAIGLDEWKISEGDKK